MRRSRENQKGAVLVEMAIVLPIFILILLGTLEFGVVLHDYIILQNASREGARFGAVGGSKEDIEKRVREFAFGLNAQDLKVDITGLPGKRGATLTVKATYAIPFITPLLQLVEVEAFDLRAESLMRLE